ncbi:PIG-L deacetylase family protein [Roseateles violae]|uniref:PIG-L family deacetylase n=1 Tax=Roseateles violae TaxID=3058042 RepID=A0ABT8DVV6_9BURK|nr:PIG-L family deacetylase [Pelomonas sp. PFR6]MDN3920522.1 PIG-L family deacetylase [Pelomonas sp. PFR6]
MLPPALKPERHLSDAEDLARWQAWVEPFAELLGAPASAAPARLEQAGGSCLIFAPHPDDECIVGALPLRLRREAGWQITNVAVTLGSNRTRRAERWQELEAACALLGFANIRLREEGFEDLKPDTATREPALWRSQLETVVELLRERRPQLILLPHSHDGNATHIGVHRLVCEAVAAARLTTVLAETEFWSTLDTPNWMVETSVADTARLVQALSRHLGEVERNPYHLRLPAFLADSVRRGGELIAGAGTAAPDYAFATLYRLSAMRDGALAADLAARLCPAGESLQTAWLGL